MFIEIDFTKKVKYPDKFAPGDVAVSKIAIDFCDGTAHGVGQELDVTEINVSYFNVLHQHYSKKG